MAGENLAVGDWKMSIILYAGIVILVFVVIFVINKFDKDKVTKEAIKGVK